jgi:hypothetical protein
MLQKKAVLNFSCKQSLRRGDSSSFLFFPTGRYPKQYQAYGMLPLAVRLNFIKFEPMKKLLLIFLSFILVTAACHNKFEQSVSCVPINSKNLATEILNILSGFFVYDLSSVTNSNLTLPLIFF